MTDYDKQCERLAMLEKRFKDHEYDKLPGNWYKFAKPGTNIDMLCFQCFGGYLIVVGDLGDAIYHWNQAITLEWVAGCNLDYVMGKCQASEVGRNFVQWDEGKVVEYLEDFRDHYEDSFGCPFPDDKEDMYHRAESAATEGEFEWQCFLRDEGYELFDYLEGEYSWGETPHCRALHHLAALRSLTKKMGTFDGKVE